MTATHEAGAVQSASHPFALPLIPPGAALSRGVSPNIVKLMNAAALTDTDEGKHFRGAVMQRQAEEKGGETEMLHPSAPSAPHRGSE